MGMKVEVDTRSEYDHAYAGSGRQLPQRPRHSDSGIGRAVRYGIPIGRLIATWLGELISGLGRADRRPNSRAREEDFC